MADFFDDKAKTDTPADAGGEAEGEKITVGETEFTQEELGDLVGKAQKISEFEEKQGQKWDEVVESWGKRGERIGKLKAQVKEFEDANTQTQTDQTQDTVNQQMTPEQQEEAKKLIGNLMGDQYVSKADVEKQMDQLYQAKREGEQMLRDVNKVVNQAKKDETPATTAEDLLKYMEDPANPKDPVKAYKLMFETEIDEIKEQKLKGIKKPAMTTQTESTAGGKEFTPPKVPSTLEGLQEQLKTHMARED